MTFNPVTHLICMCDQTVRISGQRVFSFFALFTIFSGEAFSTPSLTEHSPLKPYMVTSTTDLAWVAKQIAGPDARVESLLTGSEDPHFVDVRPDYIHKVSRADAVCIVGLDLEVGWMPKVLAKSGRAHLQPGGKGYCETGKHIEVLEKPVGPIDRSMGDVHPSGNPHFWLSPSALAVASHEVTETFIRIDPERAESYRQRSRQFKILMQEIENSVQSKLVDAGVIGMKARFFEYHKEFAYFAKAFGLESLGSLEEKPGIAPSAGRIARVAEQVKSDQIKIILATPRSPKRTLARFEELSGAQVKIVPLSISESTGPADYASLLATIQDAVIASTREK